MSDEGLRKFRVGKLGDPDTDTNLQEIEQAHAEALEELRKVGNRPWVVAILDDEQESPVYFASGGMAADGVGPAFLRVVAETLNELVDRLVDQ